MRLMNYDAISYYKPTSGAYVFRALNEAIPIGNASSEVSQLAEVKHEN